jgi:CheY-like chemotaxis protein
MSALDPQILLVEDNPKDLKLTLHALQEENLGDFIQVVRDGEEALDFFSAGVSFPLARLTIRRDWCFWT